MLKYAMVIMDGAGDEPLEALDGRTPLEAARMPHCADLAAAGRVGSVETIPEAFEVSAEIAAMTLLGYDPGRYDTGRTGLEAAAMGIALRPIDWVFQVRLTTTGEAGAADAGRLVGATGALTEGEAEVLLADLLAHWRQAEPAIAGSVSLTACGGGRAILVDSSGTDYRHVRTMPPHAVAGESWKRRAPGGAGGARLRRLVDLSAEYLPGHEVNRARRQQGLAVATLAWIWGQGTAPVASSFRERFGLRGVMLSGDRAVAGLARCIGWDWVELGEGEAEGRIAAMAEQAARNVRGYDIVCWHVGAADRAARAGDVAAKVEALEAVDGHVVGRLKEALEAEGKEEGWRLLVASGFSTSCERGTPDRGAQPFVMAGAGVKGLVAREFTEAGGEESDLHVERGHDLMEYFLRGGLVRSRGGR